MRAVRSVVDLLVDTFALELPLATIDISHACEISAVGRRERVPCHPLPRTKRRIGREGGPS